MKMMFRRRSASLAVLLWVICTGRLSAAIDHEDPATQPSHTTRSEQSGIDQVIDLRRLRTIYLSPDANDAEQMAARILRKGLRAIYGIELNTRRSLKWSKKPGILLGPQLAIESGIIASHELDAVKDDGYVIRGSRDRIVLSGYAPQGTLYATYAFLKRAGISYYPWRYGGWLELRKPVASGMLPIFSIAERPFFAYRDILTQADGGRLGGTLRQYALGDLKFARNQSGFNKKGWLGWDHTAGYLVPPHLYYDEHPEYYGFIRGRRVPKSTPNLKVPLCTCEPEVASIAAMRALDWIGLQNNRKYFAITDGDSVARCPQCEASDPIPDYKTDRLLNWVNPVARAVGEKKPDKVLLTLAYLQTVKPPVETLLEPNVLIMYAPWYWRSRTTSAVSFAHPLNLTAMEEFMAWSMRFPGQIGVYDYPGTWVDGTAARIKFFAKNGVPWVYGNGARGDLLHWIASQLLWDPFLDTRALEREFLDAYYGPAADVMEKYLELRRQTIRNQSFHTKAFFRNQDYLEKARRLLIEAEEAAERSSLETQTRIFEGVTEGLYTLLKDHVATRPSHDLLRDDYQRYIRLQQRIVGNGEQLKLSEQVIRRHIGFVKKRLSALGVRITATIDKGATKKDLRKVFEDAAARFNDLRSGLRPIADTYPSVPRKRCTELSFGSQGEQGKWRTSGSQQNLVSVPAATRINGPISSLSGIRIGAPLSRLPVLARANKRAQVGRFFAERRFNNPLETAGCPFIDIHLHVSGDVPVTIYINDLRSDIHLHAGEQIVRVDLRNHDGRGRFRYSSWDKKIKTIAFDIWPQNNFYPYPEVRDVDLMVLGLEAKNYAPEPALLPYAGKAIWLSQFRPNLSFQKVIADISARQEQLQRVTEGNNRSITHTYIRRRSAEKYRTFTEHRIISPIAAIIAHEAGQGGDLKAAIALQRGLADMYDVTLPINPESGTSGPDAGNVAIVGSAAALRSGRVKQLALDHAGREGHLIRARDGRIIIAGGKGTGVLAGVTRYLTDHGAIISDSADRRWFPDNTNLFLHELYLVDKPYFQNAKIPCDLPPRTQLAAVPDNWWMPLDTDTVLHAKTIARAIKDVARQGETVLEQHILNDAARSPLSCYVAGKLTWNPFEDTSGLIMGFRRMLGAAGP